MKEETSERLLLLAREALQLAVTRVRETPTVR